MSVQNSAETLLSRPAIRPRVAPSQKRRIRSGRAAIPFPPVVGDHCLAARLATPPRVPGESSIIAAVLPGGITASQHGNRARGLWRAYGKFVKRLRWSLYLLDAGPGPRRIEADPRDVDNHLDGERQCSPPSRAIGDLARPSS